MRNVLQTVGSKASSAIQQLNIHLNQCCPLSFARNILILEVISSPSFDTNNAEDINYLWDLWYNLHWPESTFLQFKKDVENLMSEMDLTVKYDLTSSQLNDLKDIFTGWLEALSPRLTKGFEINKLSIQR